jgi:signal transduction histidine kinase
VTAQRAVSDLADASEFGNGAAPELGNDAEPGRAEMIRLRRRIAHLEAERAVLRDTCRSLEQFSSVAAHELADPLLIVQRSADLLEEELGDGLDPYLRSRLHSLGRVAGRARLTLETLLQDALSGERAPELGKVDLASLVEEAVSQVADHGTRIPPRIEVGSLPTITSSRALLSVVVRNLLANAVKYASPAAGAIRVDAGRDGAGWRLAVVSPGDAIPPDEAKRILGRFERGAHGRGIAGAGLGLDICSRIVKRLGGTLGLVAESGRGNSFVVWLPDPLNG